MRAIFAKASLRADKKAARVSLSSISSASNALGVEVLVRQELQAIHENARDRHIAQRPVRPGHEGPAGELRAVVSAHRQRIADIQPAELGPLWSDPF